MASYNRVVLLGNLTRDPELRYIPSGTAVSEIGLAVNDRIKRNDQWVEEATFVDVTLWGRTAEVANEYLSKGSNILIEGRLKLDTWEKDGQKRSKLRVVADRMQMVGARVGGSRDGDEHHHADQHNANNHENISNAPPDRGAVDHDAADRGQPEYSPSATGPLEPPADEIPF